MSKVARNLNITRLIIIYIIDLFLARSLHAAHYLSLWSKHELLSILQCVKENPAPLANCLTFLKSEVKPKCPLCLGTLGTL
jgi:hypothetical protein